MAVDEQVDLDEGRKAEILALEGKMSSNNLFEFLGVPSGANADEVRAAFREASRKFHPDKYFGKNLGSFKVKLDKIFRRLVEANQTLTDPTKRDAYLAANPFVRAAARATTASTPAYVPKTEAEEARDLERRERLARHPYLVRTTKVQEYLTKAREHTGKQEYSLAVNHLNNALQIDPQHAEARAMMIEVRKGAELVRSESSFQHALEALDRGDENLALQALRTAVNANPLNFLAAHKASIILGRRGELKEAASFAQKAVEAAPRNVELRMNCARLLQDAGMKALARKHIEEATRLDPDHPEVKKHGKKRWPF